jgi:hypothetical protein
MCGGGELDALSEVARYVAVYIALAYSSAFVIELFAFAKSQFDFDFAVLKVE